MGKVFGTLVVYGWAVGHIVYFGAIRIGCACQIDVLIGRIDRWINPTR